MPLMLLLIPAAELLLGGSLVTICYHCCRSRSWDAAASAVCG
jgi:hypothetical protein